MPKNNQANGCLLFCFNTNVSIGVVRLISGKVFRVGIGSYVHIDFYITIFLSVIKSGEYRVIKSILNTSNYNSQ